MPAPLRGRSLALYLAAWIPFVLLYATAVRLGGVPTVSALMSGLVSVGTAALLGLMVHRFMPMLDPGTSRTRWLVMHLMLGLTFSSLWSGFIALQLYLHAPVSEWRGFVSNAVRWQFVTAVILYVSLVAIFTVVETARRLRVQERRTAQAEASRVRAELHALRAQLNPHFLFNTLHSITTLVRAEPSTAEMALERLAGCLRHVLDVHRDAREEVALGDELAFVRDYLALERMRFGDRLIVTEDVDADLLDAPVLSFLLQPLVENSIRHGLAPIGRAVRLRLRVAYHDGRLELEVADDGAGCDQLRAERSPGIGLSAVRQRLVSRYGADASLQITTAPGEGFRVVISLPLAAPARIPPAAVAL